MKSYSYISPETRTKILLESIQDAEQQANEDGGNYVCLRTAFDMMLAVAKRHPDWPKQAATKTPEPETEFREPERLPAEPEIENEVPF